MTLRKADGAELGLNVKALDGQKVGPITPLIGMKSSQLPIKTIPKTNSNFAPENRPFNAPKGNDRLPTIHFQGRKC